MKIGIQENQTIFGKCYSPNSSSPFFVPLSSYDNGEEEHCLELWDRDGNGLKWNDTPCSFETYFICEL